MPLYCPDNSEMLSGSYRKHCPDPSEICLPLASSKNVFKSFNFSTEFDIIKIKRRSKLKNEGGMKEL